MNSDDKAQKKFLKVKSLLRWFLKGRFQLLANDGAILTGHRYNYKL